MLEIKKIPSSSLNNPIWRAYFREEEVPSEGVKEIMKLSEEGLNLSANNEPSNNEPRLSNLKLTYNGKEVSSQMIRIFQDSLVSSDKTEETICMLDEARVDVCNSDLDIGTKINSLMEIFNACIGGVYGDCSREKYLELAKRSIVMAYSTSKKITNMKERAEYLIDISGALPILIRACIRADEAKLSDYSKFANYYLKEAKEVIKRLPESKIENLPSDCIDAICERERDEYLESIELVHSSISEIETWRYDSLFPYKV